MAARVACAYGCLARAERLVGRAGATVPGRLCHDRRVTTALIYLIVMLLVAAVVFLLAAVVFGRGEELAPLAPGSSPTRLPAEDIESADVSQVKFQLVLRGYKMSEVDWVMARLGSEIDSLRARVAELESAQHAPRGEQ